MLYDTNKPLFPYLYHDSSDEFRYDADNIEELAKKDAEIIPNILEKLSNVKGFIFYDIYLRVSKK